MIRAVLGLGTIRPPSHDASILATPILETHMNLRSTTLAAAFAAVAFLPAASVPTDPPVFSNPLEIDNPFHPFVVGREKRYEVKQGHTDAEDVDNFLAETRTFHWNGADVACRILQETSLEDGEVVEISRNFFAQADDGTVYYFGETVDNYDGGVIDNHNGSWLVGGPSGSDPVETATARHPTVFMPANPEQGDLFKPEDLFPIVDETVEVLRVGVRVSTPAGSFSECIAVEESTLLSTDTERKWYAPGIGVVKVKEKGELLLLESLTDR